MGWEGSRRVYGISVWSTKIWIQQNNTDREIVSELMALGVPASNIVLGFHPPSARRLTEFSSGESG